MPDTTVADRLREIGLTRDEYRNTSPRHAALRDDNAALALRLFRDRLALSGYEAARLFADLEWPDSLLISEAQQVHSKYVLEPIGDLFIASDWPSGENEEVLAPGETTAILYRAAQRLPPAWKVLDLGCGSGTLALLLATHAEKVIGIDVNPRAVSLSQLNAEFNGIGNVQFLYGSLFSRVQGMKFDLIVSQPPYVPQPPATARHVFLHGGERGDELARQILSSALDYLSDAGRALVFSDWPLREGELLKDRVPHLGGRLTLEASPMLTLESYASAYGLELAGHLRSLGMIGIRQCLTTLEHGEGITERLVLPHDW